MADRTSEVDDDAHRAPAPVWIWPVRFPRGIALRTLRHSRSLADAIGAWYWWLACGALIGTMPLLLGYLTGVPGQQPASALLLMPVAVAAVSRDWTGRGLAAIAGAFIAHCSLAITLSILTPAPEPPLLPDGAGYWAESKAWIDTGVSPEYEVSYWLPVHGQLVISVAVLSYLSLGMTTFWGGFYQVDLMNYYVSQLVVHSQNPLVALSLGWHPWSALRGVGYLLITFEVASLSLQRMTGEQLSTRKVRAIRWAGGLVFVLADCLVKYTVLDTVRSTLAGNLL